MVCFKNTCLTSLQLHSSLNSAYMTAYRKMYFLRRVTGVDNTFPGCHVFKLPHDTEFIPNVGAVLIKNFHKLCPIQHCSILNSRTLQTLFQYLKTEKNVNTEELWESMKDLVIKTIIAGEASISSLTKANITSRYNCYELFGIDVLLDEDLKPWLLEVNYLHTSQCLILAPHYNNFFLII